MHRPLLLAALLCLCSCSTEPASPTPPEAGLRFAALVGKSSVGDDLGVDPEGGLADSEPGKTGAPRRIRLRIPDNYIAVHVEFDSAESCSSFKVPGATVFARFQKWAEVFMLPRGEVEAAIRSAPGFVALEGDRWGITPPPPVLLPAASRGKPELVVRGGIGNLKGRGVYVAIVDTGLDFRHPDFITPDDQGRPTSRVAWLWDTTSDNHLRGIGGPGPIKYPNGAPVGTVYTRDQLTEELRASQKRIGSTDVNGHGTNCAGVAAGNGAAYPNKRYAGVAPEADLIGVRIAATAGSGVENMYLLNAICGWIDQVAGARPCVISCSFGGKSGSNDGSLVLERQLDARFASSVRSRAICIAAGNEGEDRIHSAVSYKSKEAPGKLAWTVPARSLAVLRLCYSTGDYNDVGYEWAGQLPKEPASVSAEVTPFRKELRVTMTLEAGTYAMNVFALSGTPGKVDAYLASGPTDPLNPPESGAFFTSDPKAGYQIDTPGTAQQAITVGSYDFNDILQMNGQVYTMGSKAGPLTMGGISGYSNPGPRRDGLLKPDLAAPGRLHTAPRPMDKPKNPKQENIETSGLYTYFAGTSAATPYAAGVIALMFEKNPGLTVGQIRAILQAKLTDPQAGPRPGPAWGYGKLDLEAVRRILAEVKAP